MKYYVLDLTPETSLIRYLVTHGFTVFCISWRNPGPKDRDLGLDDYRTLGIMAALDAIKAIAPNAKVHAVGYCLGGTLLSVAAAAMAQAGQDRLASISLLAAQTDFSEPGELALFIDHSQTHFLESVMWNRGTLGAEQMAGAFALLRSNDLIWSRMVRAYLLGERPTMTALDAWNADATRLPYRMHSEYLRHFYLDNALANGKLVIDGRPATLQSIRAPIFAVGTETDHVAPWTSVFKIHHLADADVTFVLTSGGHNVGIVNPPENSKRHFRIATKPEHALCQGPHDWIASNPQRAGSWWSAWTAWLSSHSSATRQPSPPIGMPHSNMKSLDDAPGRFVRQA